MVSAASLIRSVTACGWETIARWPDATSIVVAPIRLANILSASGGMAWSPVATRYHDGRDFHAGSPMTSSKVLIERPCCTAYKTFAITGSTSAAK